MIAFADGGLTVLTLRSHCGLEFPSVEIPRNQRLAARITREMKERWGYETICLFEMEIRCPGIGEKATLWQVVECHRIPRQPDSHSTWHDVSSLSPEQFSNSIDYAMLERSRGRLRTKSRTMPFSRLGWFQELRAWVEEKSRPFGIRLAGTFCQFNASPSFSLIRFDTNTSPVWFKAVGEPNQHELPVTNTLSEVCQPLLPTLIATRPEWGAWLMSDGGTPVTEIDSTLAEWRQIAADLAMLQISSIPHSSKLLGAGSRDLRTTTLLALVEPFFETMRALMLKQAKPSPPPLSSAELDDVAASLKDALTALGQSEFPVTLGHSDLNPGNILWTGSRAIFIDWAESHVGHPLVTYEYLRAHLRKSWPDMAGFEAFVRTAYIQPWKYHISAQSMANALLFSPLVAVFAYAVNLWRSRRGQADRPETLAYLRSLTRQMKREASVLEAGTALCALR